MSNLSDIYFYYELKRCIGPKQSDEWLQTCVVQNNDSIKMACARSLSNGSSKSFSVSFSSNSTAETVETDLGHALTEQGPVKSCKNKEVEPENQCFDKATTDDRDIAALDLCPHAETLTNLGLLFTDAAHVVFSQAETRRAAKSFRKFGSSFF